MLITLHNSYLVFLFRPLQHHNTKGLQKMDLTQIPILIYIIIITGLTAYVCFSLGFRMGHSEGYLRGRAIAKALKEQEVSA